ncbi:ABC transporter substrate-binding protein [Salibacterium aidingense]|uniref:ABC transporter substrate-binding protein n=1 Tax=Salibacterium aidingense TaxID=384933 RepID=UPI00041BA6C7|nr:extracellular solute-binding protein [Salibacterium aidingense]
MKKELMAVTCSWLLAGSLAGCGGDGGGEASGNDAGGSSGNDSVTLSMLVSETANLNGIEAVAEAVEEEHNISVEIEQRPGGPEGENVVKTRLATDDMSDLVLFNSGALLQTIDPPENFVDLTDEPNMDRVHDSYKETVTTDGRIYGVPANSSQVGAWLYNKKVYDELDLEIPKTWDQLMENNQMIKDAGKTAVIASYNEIWTAQLPLLADFYNVQAEEPEFAENYTAGDAKFADTSAALRGFEKIWELGVEGENFFNEDFNATTYNQGMEMLATGEGVHYPMLSQVLPIMEENYPDAIGDIGVFPQPNDTEDINGFTVWMPDALLINKNTEKMEAAKQWVEFFISKEGLEIYADAAKSIGPFVVDGIQVPDDAFEAVKQMQPYFDEGSTAPALEFVSPIKGANLPQITSEVGAGIREPQEAAEMYDDDAEKQANQLGIDGW